MSEYDKEFDELWDKAGELIGHVNTLVESIGTLFKQEEYDKVIKVFGIHFKADIHFAGHLAAKARYGSVMSLADVSELENADDFNAEQKRRREEFDK